MKIIKPKVKLYDQYDYETIFDQILKAEHEEALKIESIMFGSRKSLYCTKTIKYGTQLDCEIFPSFFSRHDLPREKKKERTPEQMRDLNDRNARKMAVRIINLNFNRDDLWCEFGYDDKHIPPDEETARKDIRNYFRKVNYHRKKLGLPPARYFYATEHEDEYGNPVRAHHHVIISGDMDRDLLEKLWDKEERGFSRRVVPDDFGLKGMAYYITKVRKAKNGKYIKRWGASKGLKQPKPTKSYSRFSRKKIRSMVENHNLMKETFEKSYPGYLFQGCEVRTNDINGGIYLYAQLRMIPTQKDNRRKRKNE